jgi:hypothetical protein
MAMSREFSGFFIATKLFIFNNLRMRLGIKRRFPGKDPHPAA